jgi:hypothetical protein
MSYKYSKGSQVIGDLKAADDSQRDTQIDFGEDQIDFHTSGSMKMQIANDSITTTLPIHISGSAIEGLRLAKGGSDYRAIVFEVDGVDNANISVSNAENFVIQNEMNGKDIQFWVNPSAGSSVQAVTIKESAKVGINTTSPTARFHVNGSVAGKLTIADSFPYTVGDDDYIILVEGTGNPRRINLPAVSGQEGRILIIKDATGNASSNNIELDPNASEQIDGTSDKLINTNRTSLTIVCDSGQWLIISSYTG